MSELQELWKPYGCFFPRLVLTRIVLIFFLYYFVLPRSPCLEWRRLCFKQSYSVALHKKNCDVIYLVLMLKNFVKLFKPALLLAISLQVQSQESKSPVSRVHVDERIFKFFMADNSDIFSQQYKSQCFNICMIFLYEYLQINFLSIYWPSYCCIILLTLLLLHHIIDPSGYTFQSLNRLCWSFLLLYCLVILISY